jgi:hypothetical protein
MKTLIAALALSAAMATGAMAQGASDAGSSAATGATANRNTAVTMDQQNQIRTYWRAQRPASQAMPANTSVSTGDSIPASMELRPFPNDMNMNNYRYVVSGERLFLVDNSTRKVVHIIQ